MLNKLLRSCVIAKVNELESDAQFFQVKNLIAIFQDFTEEINPSPNQFPFLPSSFSNYQKQLYS